MYHRHKFFENNKIEEGTTLNTTNTSSDPYDYDVEKCGLVSFKKLEHSLIHTCWPGHGEDEDDISDEENAAAEGENEEYEDLIETRYLNGNNEVVKVFNQKCLVCLESLVFMLLDNGVTNAFVKTVMEKKVFLTY